MKKILLLFAIIGAALLMSCGKEPHAQPEQPKELKSPYWLLTNVYHNATVTCSSLPPKILEQRKESEEKEMSIDIPETESLQLSFEEDGTGIASGFRQDGSGRYNFGFVWWEPDEDILLLNEIGGYYEGFAKYNYHGEGPFGGRIEEYTADKMVLLAEGGAVGTGEYGSSKIVYTTRYTFKKVD